MRLDNFKPVWRHFKLINGLKGLSEADILAIIEIERPISVRKLSSTHFSVYGLLVFLLFTCCQSC